MSEFWTVDCWGMNYNYYELQKVGQWKHILVLNSGSPIASQMREHKFESNPTDRNAIPTTYVRWKVSQGTLYHWVSEPTRLWPKQKKD